MNKKVLSIGHLVTLALLIFWNYYSNTGAIAGNTVGSVSDRFDNLFTPAGYAFAIWGVIYLGLIVLAIYMVYCSFSKHSSAEFVSKAAPTLLLAHIGNGTWLWFWLHEDSGISVLVMLFILCMLTLTVIRLNMERWDAPLKFITLVWWPIDLYVGWISVATIANISAHLGSVGWNGGLSEITWTILAIALATLLSGFMILTRNMREFGGVVIWALIAIAVRHWNEISILQWTAVVACLIISIIASIHAYRNRATLPIIRKYYASGYKKQS